MSKPMSENARTVLTCLKENYGNDKLTYLDIAEKTGIAAKSVNALVTHALIGSAEKGRGLAKRVAFEVTDAEGKVSTKNGITLTEKGLTYDPDSETVTEA